MTEDPLTWQRNGAVAAVSTSALCRRGISEESASGVALYCGRDQQSVCSQLPNRFSQFLVKGSAGMLTVHVDRLQRFQIALIHT